MHRLAITPLLVGAAWVLLGPMVPSVRLAAQTQSPYTVEIPVLVLDHHGQPVFDIDQDQFRLNDNGRTQRITEFERAARPVALAIVVDTSDYDAVAQAHRSAELMTAMVMGANGEASVYISGPQPRQVLPFTRDHDQVANTLRHLEHTPTPPLGQGQITVPAGLALLDLTHQPDADARAVLVIAKDPARTGPDATALVDDAMQHAIAIFRIAPHQPDNTTKPANPDSVAARGTGQGSQRDPYVIPNGARPGMPDYEPNDQATINLTPIPRTGARLAGDVFDPHQLDYVYDSGGLTLGAGDNADFDRKLSSIGADLRSLYYLYFRPNDLGAASRRHQVSVEVLPPPQGSGNPYARLAYRRAYLAPPER